MSEEELARWEEHLLICDSCQRQVAASDTYVAAMRSAAAELRRAPTLLLLVVLEHLEERVREEFLLEVLLQVEQRHVQHVHRLIEARIDLELLPKTEALVEPSLHPAGSGGDSVGCTAAALARADVWPPCSSWKRVRSRAVSVGPR